MSVFWLIDRQNNEAVNREKDLLFDNHSGLYIGLIESFKLFFSLRFLLDISRLEKYILV